MAKRRILKKEIYYTFGDMLFDTLIYQYLAPKENQEKVESLISRINQCCNEFICRAHHAPNKKNKSSVKQYYKKLLLDLDHEIEQFSQEIEALSNDPNTKHV